MNENIDLYNADAETLVRCASMKSVWRERWEKGDGLQGEDLQAWFESHCLDREEAIKLLAFDATCAQIVFVRDKLLLPVQPHRHPQGASSPRARRRRHRRTPHLRDDRRRELRQGLGAPDRQGQGDARSDASSRANALRRRSIALHERRTCAARSAARSDAGEGPRALRARTRASEPSLPRSPSPRVRRAV